MILIIEDDDDDGMVKHHIGRICWYLQQSSFNFPFLKDSNIEDHHDDHDDNDDDIIILGGWMGICSGAHSTFPFKKKLMVSLPLRHLGKNIDLNTDEFERKRKYWK